MEVLIRIRDLDNGEVEISESRLPHEGETEDSVTVATALVDEIQQYIAQLGETE